MKGSLVGIAAVLLLVASAAPLGERLPSASASSSAAGYYAFIDPETGEFTDAGDPASIPLSEDLLQRIDTSDEGLVEEPGSVSGVTVRLQGRFSGLAVSATAEDGSGTVKCLSGMPVGTGEVRR
jgi:hypothetical protein